MKNYRCQQCNHTVFFHSNVCVNCNTLLGFDPESLELLSLYEKDGILTESGETILLDASGREFLQCQNGIQYGVCNWLRPADSQHPHCKGCQYNRTIPDLSNPVNIVRWNTFEYAKKRLLFSLFKLKVPVVSGHQNPDDGLLFDFIEDHRTNPNDFSGDFVHTGHLDGLITINVLEADEVQRAAVKQQMNETYRTLIGHLRHESGHYVWSFLGKNDQIMAEFREIFGNDRVNYSETMNYYYANGPVDDWQLYYISAYASSHPWEDWAESWGHYLFIYDAIETAIAHDIVQSDVAEIDIKTRISLWRKLSIKLNELNRCAGLNDIYPFVLNQTVERKLAFVDKAIHSMAQMNQAALS